MQVEIFNFADEHLMPIMAILTGAFVVRQFAMLGISKLVRRTIKHHHFNSERAEKQREDTVVNIIGAAVRVGVWLIAGLLLLGELGLEIGPLIAGAGILGVALGFGAQSLVKDFLAGIFIILENQYRVGDVVRINQNIAGIVEDVSLRQTVLRDLDGMVHHIPNGYIEVAANMTMEYANVNLDVGVSYSSDLEKVEKVINETGNSLAKDTDWTDRIIEAPQFLRVDDFADSAIIIKILGKTQPIKQWEVTGELRKRLKIAFDKAGIEIPFPQVTVHQSKK